MTDKEYDNYVQSCIKAELRTLYPEEYETQYGEGFVLTAADLVDINHSVEKALTHIQKRTSWCDLVDDKTSEEIDYFIKLADLCNRFCVRFDWIKAQQ